MARYAIGRLYRPLKNENSEHSSPNGSEEDPRSTLCGLEPMNFITVATPHLGSRGNKQVTQLPFHLFIQNVLDFLEVLNISSLSKFLAFIGFMTFGVLYKGHGISLSKCLILLRMWWKTLLRQE